jgi:purine-binding chemotaxis protein CheW
MAKVKGQVKTLLDIDRVVAPETVQAIAQAI